MIGFGKSLVGGSGVAIGSMLCDPKLLQGALKDALNF